MNKTIDMGQGEGSSPDEVLGAQSDRFDDFFANENNESEEPIEADPVDDGTDGMDEPFLDDDPDYDPDALDDPDEVEEEPEGAVKEAEPEDDNASEDDNKASEKESDEPEDKDGDEEKLEDDSDDFAKFKEELMAEIEANATDPQAGKKWADLRARERQARMEVEQMKAGEINTPEMQEIKARAERLSDVEVQLKETQEKLAMYDFQSSPEYQKEIQAPYEAMRSDAQAIESTASIPEGEILKAISASNRATQDANIQALIDNHDIPRRDEVSIYQMANDMLALTAKDAQLRETASERLSESREAATAREAYMAEQEKASYRNHLQDTFKEYEGKVGAFLNPDGTNNEQWTQAIKDSEGLDFKGDPEIQALGAYALTTVPHLMKQNDDYSAEISKLRTLLNRQKGVAPPSVSKATNSVKSSASKSKARMSLSDAIGARLNE